MIDLVARVQHKQWSDKNPEKVRGYRKKYYEKNKDRHKRWAADWKARNPDKVREYSRKWREKNPEKVKEYIEEKREYRRLYSKRRYWDRKFRLRRSPWENSILTRAKTPRKKREEPKRTYTDREKKIMAAGPWKEQLNVIYALCPVCEKFGSLSLGEAQKHCEEL